ncbi:MAG TPA: DUF72 domain-containing protein [Blastocatellia bacterium]|nr:DUF72 domain-containing protein [Blastocatellia bacterium]
MANFPDIHIGTQGWNYEGWVGSFYPRGTRPTDFLDLYTRVFDTVEIDSSFYAIPSEASIQSWYKRAPAGFTFSLKLPQEITHHNRLQNSADVLSRFCDRVRGLQEKLALILIQLPPDFSPRSLPALESFLPLLPPEMNFAIEFRDRQWLLEDIGATVLELLTAHHVALTLADSKWLPRELMLQLAERPTAAFAYLRWLGPNELTDYSRIQINRDQEFALWTKVAQSLQPKVKSIHGYFNNHFQGHSPASANHFKQLLGQPTVDPSTLDNQPSLF